MVSVIFLILAVSSLWYDEMSSWVSWLISSMWALYWCTSAWNDFCSRIWASKTSAELPTGRIRPSHDSILEKSRSALTFSTGGVSVKNPPGKPWLDFSPLLFKLLVVDQELLQLIPAAHHFGAGVLPMLSQLSDWKRVDQFNNKCQVCLLLVGSFHRTSFLQAFLAASILTIQGQN